MPDLFLRAARGAANLVAHPVAFIVACLSVVLIPDCACLRPSKAVRGANLAGAEGGRGFVNGYNVKRNRG
jgi:hypothetical protein